MLRNYNTQEKISTTYYNIKEAEPEPQTCAQQTRLNEDQQMQKN